MATWKLSTQYKKSSVERQFWYKGDKVIIREEGYRWGTFSVESDVRPLSDADLKNEDGYELGCIENDECWELWDLTDGCWADTEAGRNCTEEDLEEFNTAWDEDTYEAVEALGWMQDDTEYFYYGPLELTNQDTGEVFQGEPSEPQEKTEEQLKAELDDLIATMPKVPEEDAEEEPAVTDWFPADVKPAHKGTYQAITAAAPMWPFPSMVEWNGKKWSEDIKEWRGLAEEPKASWPF